MSIVFLLRRGQSAIRNPRSAIVLLLLVALAGLLAACEGEPTPVPQGPPGPQPSPTIAPTETPISVTGSGAEAYQAAHDALLRLTSYHFVIDTDLGRGATQHIEGNW